LEQAMRVAATPIAMPTRITSAARGPSAEAKR
jgi:hypothetical protein